MKTKTPITDEAKSEIIGFFSCATVPASVSAELETSRDEFRNLLKEAIEAIEFALVRKGVTEDSACKSILERALAKANQVELP